MVASVTSETHPDTSRLLVAPTGINMATIPLPCGSRGLVGHSSVGRKGAREQCSRAWKVIFRNPTPISLDFARVD